MIRALLITALMLLPSVGIGQAKPYKLTLKQMIDLLDKDDSEVNDYLIERNWVFYEAKKPSKDAYGGITWRYEPQGSFSDRAVAFFILNLDDQTILGEPLRVRMNAFYQHHSPDIQKALKAEVASYGMKQIKSDFFNDGSMYTDYAGKNYVCRFRTAKGDNSKQVFTVYLYKKYNYELYRP
ncbi:hypothetical protein K3G39_04820 [Pontibacter sp. HSC-14F20]|uniref:hypothetical protein n=1 Tax=Pontibacter sp. HSC-14F20 TaxID=2864136 RepID=UPI001C73C363|nr:hypothetical protein [Pontibacter sp. HSC-14F20]MBX0332555.1 hypothetical protein [Pontibacter sp. HSC-14F20]